MFTKPKEDKSGSRIAELAKEMILEMSKKLIPEKEFSEFEAIIKDIFKESGIPFDYMNIKAFVEGVRYIESVRHGSDEKVATLAVVSIIRLLSNYESKEKK